MNRPTPKEFAAKLITLMLPAIIAFIVFIVFIACKPTEEMYRVSGPEMYTIYHNKQGDLIEKPWNNTECQGYKKPFHTTQYNKHVGTNKR